MATSRKRKTNGKLKTIQQLEHLDPKDERSLTDHIRTKMVAEFERNLVVTAPDLLNRSYQYTSLKDGDAYKPDGSKYREGEFKPDMLRQSEARNGYNSDTLDRNGKRRLRWRDVPYPLDVDPITLNPMHDLQLKRLDRAGYDCRPLFERICLKAAKHWNECDPNAEVVAYCLHPNSEKAHQHMITSTVTIDSRQMNDNPHLGNNRTARAGVGLIGMVRLYDMGLEDSKETEEFIDRCLSKRIESSQNLPPDYLVSLYVDRIVEKELEKLKKKQKYKDIIELAESEYKRDYFERKALNLKLLENRETISALRNHLIASERIRFGTLNYVEAKEKAAVEGDSIDYKELYENLKRGVHHILAEDLKGWNSLKERARNGLSHSKDLAKTTGKDSY